MYSRQKGLLPVIISVGGFLLFAILTLSTYLTTFLLIGEPNPLKAAVKPLVLIAFGMPIALVSLVIANLFPAIRIVKEGIRYRYISLFVGIVKWENVEEIVKTSRLSKLNLWI